MHLIIWRLHVDFHHSSAERTLAEARYSYWIIRGRQIIKSVLAKCMYYRRNAVNPGPPLKAELPQFRLEDHVLPFSNTGIDMFGPFFVSILRRSVKRYIIIFTYLSTRVVHLEIVHSADLDSFIQAFHRFTASELLQRQRDKLQGSGKGDPGRI